MWNPNISKMYLPSEIITLAEATTCDFSLMRKKTKLLIEKGMSVWLHNDIYTSTPFGKFDYKKDCESFTSEEDTSFSYLLKKANPLLERRDYLTLFSLLGSNPDLVTNENLRATAPRKGEIGSPIPCQFSFDMDKRDVSENSAKIDIYAHSAIPTEFENLEKVVDAYKKNKLDFELEFMLLPEYADESKAVCGKIKKGGVVQYDPGQGLLFCDYPIVTLKAPGVKIYNVSSHGDNLGKKIRVWRNEQAKKNRGFQYFKKLINLFESPKEWVAHVEEKQAKLKK